MESIGRLAGSGSGWGQEHRTWEDTTLAYTFKYSDNPVIYGDVGGGHNQETGPGPAQAKNLPPLPTKHQLRASLSSSLRSDTFPLKHLLPAESRQREGTCGILSIRNARDPSSQFLH